MDYLVAPFELIETKAGKDGPEFSGYVSTYGNIDAGLDVVMPGAFDRTIKERAFRPLLWGHQQNLPPIGGEKSLVSDEKGLLGTWELNDTDLGESVYKALKRGHLRSMSMGYVPINAEYDGDVRKLIDIELLESSVVNVPMNDEAIITAVKHRLEEDESKAEWSAAFINDLPDSSFAVILPGGTKDADGKTTPRSLRKLPHHGPDGALDMAHLRNAMSREPQTDMPDAMHSRAHSHLQAHMGNGGKSSDGLKFDEHLDFVMVEIAGLLARSEEIAALRAGEGKRLSGTKVEQLKTLRAGVDDLLRLEDVPAADVPKSATSLRLAIARRRLAMAARMESAR